MKYLRFASYWQLQLANNECDEVTAEEFRNLLGGRPIGGGIYVLFAQDELPKWTDLIDDLFPGYVRRFRPVGRDWLGRVFIEVDDSLDDESQIRLIDPRNGDRYIIPGDFESLHQEVFVDQTDDALEAEEFQSWRAKFGNLASNQCVGMKTPAVLGGEWIDSNKAVSDAEVYWSFLSQVTRQVRGPWF